LIFTSRDLLYTLGLSALFVGAFLFLSFINSFFIAPMRLKRSLRQRVDSVKRGDVPRAGILKTQQVKGDLILRLLGSVGRTKMENLQRKLQQGDIEQDASIFLGIVILMALVGFIIGNLKTGFIMSLVMGLAMGLLPFFYLKMRRGRKSDQVEKQMPEVMELLARSLRAGHTLPSAIELAGQENPPPLGTELYRVYEEQRLGISLSKALLDMVKRVDSQDLRYFVTGVLIQAETGGSLAELMEKIGHLIRERLKLKLKVQALTSEGRISALILEVLPFAIFFFLYLFQPKYLHPLFHDPLGVKMLIGAGVMMVLGMIVIKRLIRIDI
jgi:tight adherence protein B